MAKSMKQSPTYEDYEFIRQLPEFIKYIRKFGNPAVATELWQEFRELAASGATKGQLESYQKQVMTAKRQAERLIV